MRRFTLFILSLWAFMFWIAVPEHALRAETPQQKSERIRWWREARFGMFIHWGPVSLKGTEISWSRGGERRGIEGKGEIPVDVYDNLYRQFDPEQFNAAEWVSVAESAGMKYMVLTAKHCDGFCLWRSAVDDYCMSATPFKRDVCGELASAAHAAGMRIGWYYSPMDWRDPDCRTPRNEVYLRKMRGHLRELLGGYGRIDLVWFDYDGGPDPWDQENTYQLVRGLQPGVIIDDRLSLGPVKNNDPMYIDPPRRLPDSGAEGGRVRRQGPMGNLHDARDAMVVEAGRQDQDGRRVRAHTRPVRDRGREPSPGRRPDAGRQDRAPPGGSPEANRRVAGEVR
jgi:hypothetical protein